MPERTPYTPDHVAYVHEAGEVTALYIPDPRQAADPTGTWKECRDIAWWRASGIEAIGAVVRDGRRWRWEREQDLNPFPDDDPLRKEQAVAGLRRAVVRHFRDRDLT